MNCQYKAPDLTHLLSEDETIKINQKKVFWTVIITFITMILEVVTGILSGSMALLADGQAYGQLFHGPICQLRCL